MILFGATYVVEKFETPFNGIEEKSYYLYISPEYYDINIKNIEDKIKKLEKTFSRQDYKNFENEYNKDLNVKQYELESARVYESASMQIDLKKQKFNQLRLKMINEYGKKYEEIMLKDISDEEKRVLAYKLFDETRSYDEKNRQAVLRLDLEYEQLSQNFKGKVQDSETIYSQMQNLHLFDKARYFEDMRASINPELRDLYRQRYLLNLYRISHNKSVYNGNSNPFIDLFKGVLSHIRYGKTPLMLRSTF